ncbi:CHAT domain-containing protein [Ephemerocybe angulata]|uniref:CHAT domain-containing protein n=1 Tax=Ephemerocybe angulata TaxID=980116 RepID=A0A8H6M808_9AGAR|nr:CHAT domain-containing protein [Tulosesus angulatus]
MPVQLNNLGYFLDLLFSRTGDLRDLTEAISMQRKSLDLTSEGEERIPIWLNELGLSLDLLFKRTGNLRDLTEAISMHRKALDLTPEGHADMPTQLNNVGSSLELFFRRTGDLRDLTEAISMQRKALDLTPEGHAIIPTCLNNLALSLDSLFNRTGDLHSLTEAISMRRKVLEITPEGHPSMPGRLNNLGCSLCSLCRRTENLRDLTEAISMQRKSLDLAAEGHAHIPMWLNNLGYALVFLFQCTGDLRDLTEAISIGRKAVELTPEDHASKPIRLNNLALSLDSLFRSTGSLHDLTEAILIRRRAVEITPEGHADMAMQLNNLGCSLDSLFIRAGDLRNLTEAISMQRMSLDLTPEGHVSMPMRLSNLGLSLDSLSRCTGNMRDLTEVISIRRKAVEITPEGHADMAMQLNNLSSSLNWLFKLTGNLRDLTEAVSITRKVLEIAPEGHANMHIWLHNLASSLLSLFIRTGDLRDLTEAISIRRKALKIAPKGHVGMLISLNHLGISLEYLFQRTGDLRDLIEAISSYRSSAVYPSGSPHVRLMAARNWTRLLNLSSPPSPAILSAFDTSIYLITLTATLEQTMENRYRQLQVNSGVTLEAASAALMLNRVDKALEWLEQGRCLVWGQLNNLRTPLDDLRNCNAQLAARIMQVSKVLEAAGSYTRTTWTEMSLSEKTSLAEQAQDNLNLSRQWDGLLEEVRVIPGFESFLKPVSCTTLLQHLPDSGPVIVINIDTRRCDAIALLPGRDQPLHIPLPDFSLELCNQYREGLTAQLRSFHLRYRGESALLASESEYVDDGRGIRPVSLREKNGETVIRKILRGLWEKLVTPILQRLELSKVDQPSERTLPRIWWCPTGPLSFLPIHAAGIYGNASSESLMDYAISSYIPTVAALTDRIKNIQSIDKESIGVFMVSQPKVDGASPIPGTTTEVRAIYEVITAVEMRAKKLEETNITAAECLDIMDKYSIVHLACHGSQNTKDPLKSRFLFHDGSLELGTIIQRSLKNADLAFLSACQTSTGVDDLPDEAVHLAAGMLAAGYRRVVATMWSIGDRDAPALATDFYQYLLDHRSSAIEGGLDGRFSAHALHHATKQLRLRLDDNSDQSLLTWIPYVHFGY